MNYEGTFQLNETHRFALVVSRFNDVFTKKLEEGAKDCLIRHGAQESQIDTFWVSGCFEIPLVLKKLAKAQKYQAMVALGVVIRGNTPHFDYVCHGCTSGLQQVTLDTNLPIAFGVLTTDTLEQAQLRSSSSNLDQNKGQDAALCVLEMINVLKSICS